MVDHSVGREHSYEYLIQENANTPFDELSVEQQRDELLSAMGLMVTWAYDALPDLQRVGIDYVLMRDTVANMGNRYGPWRR